jgi:hypothetical protein
MINIVHFDEKKYQLKPTSPQHKLLHFIEIHLNVSVSGFEKEKDFTRGSLRRYINSNTNIGIDKVIVIKKAHPELNLNWWLGDDGNMLCDHIDTSVIQDDEERERLDKEIEFYRKTITNLTKVIGQNEKKHNNKK